MSIEIWDIFNDSLDLKYFFSLRSFGQVLGGFVGYNGL